MRTSAVTLAANPETGIIVGSFEILKYTLNDPAFFPLEFLTKAQPSPGLPHGQGLS